MIEKATFSAFTAFWAAVVTILAMSLLAPEARIGAAPGTAPASSTAEAEGEALPVIGHAELARHDRREDCWLAIEGQVYDVTDYIPQHPTPPGVLARWCGREATEGMRTKGYGSDHSARAWSMLERYRVGTYAPDG